jgi:hypothetical protein
MEEAFHQVQMFLYPGPTLYPNIICQNYNPMLGAFGNLIEEQMSYGKGIAVYDYGDLSQYKTMYEMPYFESQARMVGDYAELYIKARKGISLSIEQINLLKEMNRILINTGFISQATNWVKENIKVKENVR